MYTVNAAAAVGVPVIAAVEDENVSPDGNAGDTRNPVGLLTHPEGDGMTRTEPINAVAA